MNPQTDPLVAALPAEVPLASAPLVRVIAQIRFPEILSVERREFVAPFQESIRKAYPVLREEQTQGFTVGTKSVAPFKSQVIWRFSDGQGRWHVSLAPTFLALETTEYQDRADFMRRLRELVEALAQHIEPAHVDRLGIRYIDRIAGDDVNAIETLIRPEVRGISGTASGAHATHSITESMFQAGDIRLLARWGCLPPMGSVDPVAIPPLDKPTWILDLDAFSAERMAFDAETIVSSARRYAERIYTVFRWAVTDEFLVRYGGQP